MRSGSSPRILVIGGGPAGSLAGILLAKEGLAPTIAEAKSFPRDKVCGECLSALGVATLERHGLTTLFPPPHRFTHASLVDTAGRASRLQLPSPMWALTRTTLDTTLLDFAAKCGARVLQPTRVESIGESTAITASLRSTTGVISEDFDLMLDASAKPLHVAASTADIGIKAHFVDVSLDPHTIHLFAVPTGYVGLAAVGPNLWNLAYSIKAQTLKTHNASLADLFAFLLTTNPALREALRAASATTPWLTSGLPRHPLPKSIDPRRIPVGNAAAALDPVGGQGMGLALASASAAAEAVIAAARNGAPVNTTKLLADYRQLWGRRRVACRAVAGLMSIPLSARVTTTLARRLPSASRLAMRWIADAT